MLHTPFALSPSFQARTAEELSELVENPRLNPIIVIGRLTMSGLWFRFCALFFSVRLANLEHRAFLLTFGASSFVVLV
ncbi:hypothetical protein CC2G_008495 [Coprinopsis cinerea AmutBmut pab1-1]|nr:hypothetical protein CC2G_008495 [Coprinopsis cinerea AmutBmut pab1-1]